MQKIMPQVMEALTLLAPAAVGLVVAGIGPAIASGLIMWLLHS